MGLSCSGVFREVVEGGRRVITLRGSLLLPCAGSILILLARVCLRLSRRLNSSPWGVLVIFVFDCPLLSHIFSGFWDEDSPQ